ncbi:protein of unknown function [Epilithonimonas hominis]|uniref:Uracil-DNA glycosylase-like domain-containing protein n=1 Tax=Epilithonimonas hominis TaxID=420404 RepID=A0A1H6HWT4_9FLAO|nr:protein of unknown function [Epilithonimonas hominis]
MKENFGEKVIDFNLNLKYSGLLPDGFRVLNPYLDNPETLDVMQQFYHKYYNDSEIRKFIIGINPSRHGAGVTGVPFTDTKRLRDICGIEMKSAYTHEISSVFVYDMIEAFEVRNFSTKTFTSTLLFLWQSLEKLKKTNGLMQIIMMIKRSSKW